MITLQKSTSEISDRILSKKHISEGEALELAQKTPIHDLAQAAHERRLQKTNPETVTYLVDRNINYTNVCVTSCKFCGFYRPVGKSRSRGVQESGSPEVEQSRSWKGEGYVLDRETFRRKMEELQELGGTRILMQGGHNPDLRLDYYLDLLHWLKKEFPAIQIDGFSPSEIEFIAMLEERSIEEILTLFKEAGLGGLPGGGAEILVDRVRARVSPKKQKSAGWLRVMSAAHRLELVTTASMVIGFGETWEERIEHLSKIRHLQEESLERFGNGFQAFIVWTAQLDQTSLRHVQGLGATTYEYLKTVALSRIFLDNIPHIQASWPTMGRDVAQLALHFGADDAGSTMMEENVVSQAGSETLTTMSVPELQRLIRGAGFIPAQRNSRYDILKVIG